MQRLSASCRLRSLFLSFALLIGAAVILNAQSTLELEMGDHVTIVGNALPERMNHFGYFESLLHTRFPKKNLVVRNIGYAGDVVEWDKNLRVQGYGSRDDWLRRLNTDVVIAMYGFNESYRGPDRVDEFRRQLNSFVEHVTSTPYNSQSPPRLALVSPIAFEDLDDPDLPEGTTQNRNLKRYTQAMKAVATQHGVPFVNLYKPTRRMYSSTDRHLTFNGIHLTEFGYKKLSWVLDRGLFGKRPSTTGIDMKNLRKAINEKNEYWLDRYRVNDGNNVYGSRSDKTYEPNNTSNREVYRREMQILEQMVANRDRKVWALSQGNRYKVKDNNLPEHIEVETSAPGTGPGGKHSFLGGRQAIKKMDLHKNMEINLFASEEQFPELINPRQIKFDTKGRMWTNTWESYPNYRPPGEKKDELIYFEDTDDDGRADRCIKFADELKNPTGFHFWNGGVIVAQSPYLLFLKDTNGDGRADLKRRMLSHISAADTHHAHNSFVWGAGGALFFQEGVFHRSQIETPYGVVRRKGGTVWRFEPDSYRVQRYTPKPWQNSHGHAINRWNQGFVLDASKAYSFHDTLFSGYMPYPKEHRQPPKLYHTRMGGAVAGGKFLSSTHFPRKMRGTLMVTSVLGHRGIVNFNIRPRGASYRGVKQEPILESSDPNFRPVGMTVGPKGALYVCDWHNPIIGHSEYHVRDPNRDNEHGRIYRITYEGRSLHEEKAIDGEPIPELLDLLKNPENSVRVRTKLELSERDSKKVVRATDRWLDTLDSSNDNYEHHLLEGLWVHQWHNTVDGPLLKKVMNSDDHRARAAAVRILGYWREQVDGARALLERAVNDDHPLVRLEAVRALSFFRNVRVVSVALQVLNHDMDEYLDYTLNETMRALKPHWKEALLDGKPIVKTNSQGLTYMLERIGNEDTKKKILQNQPGTPAVNEAILFRTTFPVERRRQALEQLADVQSMELVNLLMKYLLEKDTGARLLSLLEDVERDKLKPHADRLAELARNSSSDAMRVASFTVLAMIDGDLQRVQSIASGSMQKALNFLDALERIQHPQIRSAAYPFVRSLVFDPPSNTGDSTGREDVFEVNYYATKTKNAKRWSFKGRTPEQQFRTDRITTKLEPVHSGGDEFALKYRARLNIDTPGRYVFHLTSDDGSRLYVNGNEVINNGGTHGPRGRSGSVELTKGIHELVITHFDNGGGQTLSLQWTPAGSDNKQDVPNEAFYMGAEYLQKKAIHVLARLPKSAHTRFTDLVKAMDETGHVLTAAQEARRVARDLDQVSPELAERVVRSIVAFAKPLSAERRSQTNLDEVLDFARDFTRHMGGQTGDQLRNQLGQIKVRRITIKTVPGEKQYDTEEFTVHPGETIAIYLKNTDRMPHNLVLTVPGAYELVGKASMVQSEGPSHDYVPQGEQVQEKIMRHTSLLKSGESEQLVWQVPDTPDDYPYLCTFPGHWRTMKGIIHVRK